MLREGGLRLVPSGHVGVNAPGGSAPRVFWVPSGLRQRLDSSGMLRREENLAPFG